MNDTIAAELLARSSAGLSQHARLLALETAQGSALPDSLVAESMVVDEAVNALFTIEVMALSVSAEVDVDLLLGEELTVTLLQPDHTRRAWHGVCTAAELLGADGGMARYRLLLEPALALLRERVDSYLFQNKDARAIVMELVADYPQMRCEFDIGAAPPLRAICTQYEESDFAFLTRLLASEALSWRFEHAPPGSGERHGRHKLVVFDAQAIAPATPGGEVLRFHGVRSADSDDAIDRFGARRELRANAVAVSSWDPAVVAAPASEQRSALAAGDVPELSIYEGSGERQLADQAHADARGQAMLGALELENKTFDGAGAVRRLAAGCRFTLSQHERFPAGLDEFTVLSVRHEARNNFQPGGGAERGADAGIYRNSFSCVRSCVAIVPPAAAARRPSTAPGPQSALVVGLDNSVVTTNRDHQVLVQFAWQRGRRPNDGGLAHDVDPDGCAPGNDASGTWVRVAEALAGPNWGTLFTPRIGTETLIDFVEGDIDRPVVLSQLYNGVDRPPFPGGVDAGVEHPGVLSGIHARGFNGAGYAQWVVDDSAGQLRMRLASSCANTQLNLGYLVEQAPASSQRGEYRGSGFELRTDAWAVVRGGEGVLLTTSARAAHGCGVESTQMDAAEAIQAFGTARQLSDALGHAASQQKALFSDTSVAALDEFIEIVNQQGEREQRTTMDGQPTGEVKSGSDHGSDSGTTAMAFRQPITLLDSPASVTWASPASTVQYSAKSLLWTAQSDQHLAAGTAYSSISGQAAAYFTHEGGLQANAAGGQLSLQAHTDQLEVVANKEITVISTNNEIEIRASKSITLQAGNSAIVLEGGDISFLCPGKFEAKAAEHVFDSAARQNASFIPLPSSTVACYRKKVRLMDATSGAPLTQSPYVIRLKSGTVFYGETDEHGDTNAATSETQEAAQIITGHDALIEIARLTRSK